MTSVEAFPSLVRFFADPLVVEAALGGVVLLALRAASETLMVRVVVGIPSTARGREVKESIGKH